MARTRLFGLLRRACRKVLFARASGHTDRTTLDAAFVAHEAVIRHRRREVLGSIGGAAALASLGPSLAACGDDGADGAGGGGVAGDEKVVVVGAGIGGLHCALRLEEAGIAVELYEMQDRVGGRMFTSRDAFPEGQLCELGGELIDTNHATLFALAAELGITLDDRFAGEPAGHKRDVYVIDGAEVPEDVLLEQFEAVAETMLADVTAADEDEAAYEALDAISLDQYLKDTVPVADYPELHEVLQVAYRGEYGLENDQQGALNLLYLIGSDDTSSFRIFGESDERWHTHDGNDTFPTRVAERLSAGTVKTGHQLLSASGSDGDFTLVFSTAGGEVEVSATRIVFALPFTTLRNVDLSGLTLSDEKRDVIANLGYGTNAKIMGGFTSRVWLIDHNASGSMTTDLPIQQTWDTTIGQAGTRGILTNFIGGDRGLEAANVEASAWFQDQVDDLEAIWPGAAGAYDGVAVKMHWPTVPSMLGSYTCYRVGQWAYFGLEGAREGNIHFCGEHTSLDFQGWMEGGAESGALVAAEILDDLGVSKTAAHVQALGVKLLVPQATYAASGGMLGPDGRRMNVFQRRRVIRERLRALEARLAARLIDAASP